MEKNAGEKGKGRAPPPRAAQGHESGQDASVASRVAASAAGLARDLVRSSADASATLASGSGVAGKGGAAAASSSSWSAGHTQHAADQSRAGLSSHHTVPGLNEGFRSANDADFGMTAEFDHFSSGPGRPNEYLSSGFMDQAEPLPSWTGNEPQLNNDRYSSGYTASAIDDGAEVRMLLSNPNFSIDSPPALVEDDRAEPTSQDLFHDDYSAGQEEEEAAAAAAAREIRAGLPVPPTFQQLPVRHPLNLNPEALLSQDVESLHGAASQRSTPTSEQREHLLSEWEDVLSSYTDSVWGDQLPIVQAARAQVQAVRAGTQSLDSRAVARLQQILGHVKESSPSMPPCTALHGRADKSWHHSEAASKVDRARRPPPRSAEKGTGREETKRYEIPVFHCPWISCHERFSDALELRLHSSTHTFFSCPHVGCSEHFGLTEEWDAHLQVAHHDLLDTRAHLPPEIEA